MRQKKGFFISIHLHFSPIVFLFLNLAWQQQLLPKAQEQALVEARQLRNKKILTHSRYRTYNTVDMGHKHHKRNMVFCIFAKSVKLVSGGQRYLPVIIFVNHFLSVNPRPPKKQRFQTDYVEYRYQTDYPTPLLHFGGNSHSAPAGRMVYNIYGVSRRRQGGGGVMR